jgi:hypothetical protein
MHVEPEQSKHSQQRMSHERHASALQNHRLSSAQCEPLSVASLPTHLTRAVDVQQRVGLLAKHIGIEIQLTPVRGRYSVSVRTDMETSVSAQNARLSCHQPSYLFASGPARGTSSSQRENWWQCTSFNDRVPRTSDPTSFFSSIRGRSDNHSSCASSSQHDAAL